MMRCLVLFALLMQPALSWSTESYKKVVPPRRDATITFSLFGITDSDDGLPLLTKRKQEGRREWLQSIAKASMVSSLTVLVSRPSRVMADNGTTERFTRDTKNFAYTVTPPPTFKQTQKPVKTHLDEINFISETVKGCQFGITVDPVRINSLKEFGTPEEVAARVVTAEVNRDGVFEVTLMENPYESKDGSYILNYLSDGKRGKKRFLTKFFISRNQLYALTAQALEDNYANQKDELFGILDSFSLQ